MTRAADRRRNAATEDAWGDLRKVTRARVALGRAGASQPTDAHLSFQLAHAMARDAVHTALDPVPIADGLRRLGLSCCEVASEAADRVTYLTRPDLGRTLSEASLQRLSSLADVDAVDAPDLVIVLADGLSARAVQDHGLAMVERLVAIARQEGWSLGPLVIARQARVALGDEIAESLNAEAVVVLIGERPGLSSPDSLGAYLTYGPRRGLRDDARNCISNIRPEGLAVGTAAFRLGELIKAALHRKLSGVSLKDDSEPMVTAEDKAAIGNFLTGGDDEPDLPPSTG